LTERGEEVEKDGSEALRPGGRKGVTMRILFAHTNFPAQFGAFGDWLAARGWDVTFATAAERAAPPPGARMFRFAAAADGAPETHRHARPLDRALRTAESFAAAAVKARAAGVDPQVIVAHAGWGAGSYAKAVWPEARFVPYVEWWYRHPRPDRLPDEQPPPDEAAARARAAARNAPMLVDLAQADAALCPAGFQAAQFPDWLRARLTVAPDGVDIDAFAPDPAARARLAALGVPPDAEVVSYATRGMEPYRGFPDFMRALAALQRARPRLFAVIAGQDRVVYGAALPPGDSWKARMLAELDLDLGRVAFVGLLQPDRWRTLLQGTDCHVYLTVPFVLSWSFLEAMSVGCPLVASDAAPVREALGAGGGAVTAPLGDPATLAAAIAATLDDPAAARAPRAAARARIAEAYDHAWLWPARAEMLRRLAAGRDSPPPMG
jgi:glycosyltransferase involved in cell wall biosynthesis